MEKETRTTQSLPFEGIKILDFCWVAAGPVMTRYLADFGATVIRIESPLRADILRSGQPFKDDIPGINRSGYYANYNTNKLSLGLNMSNPKAIGIVKALIPQIDIVTESFTPGTMEKWGLGYDDLRQIRPDLIYFSASMFGRGGPYSRQPGFGGFLTPFTGFSNITGWPDRPPAGPYGPYTDFLVPRFGLVALIGALEHRLKTGEGAQLDMSQLEAALHFLAPILLEYTANGRETQRKGNKHTQAAPHSVFPCFDKPQDGENATEESWIAIACFQDTEWDALRKVMGTPSWANSPSLSTLEGRKQQEDYLNENIARWTINQEAKTLMVTLQAAGVPAGMVNNTKDLFSDPQLLAREHWINMDHPEMGDHSFDAVEVQLSGTKPLYKTPSPLLGQHSKQILADYLNISAEESEQLINEGVVY